MANEIPNELLHLLRDHIGHRRLCAGILLLDQNRHQFDRIGPSHGDSAKLLGYLAQWIDAGFDDYTLLPPLIARFSAGARIELSLLDYAHLRMAEGAVAMHEEETQTAIRHFEFVRSLGSDVPDKELAAVAGFWIGRCRRQNGQYDDALQDAVQAKEQALDLGFGEMASMMQLLESWILFQKGKSSEAVRILREAETRLASTDDWIGRGNVQSAYGRIARRDGKYDLALQHCSAAIGEYERSQPPHRNLARALANLAFVERLLALRLQKKIDNSVARRSAVDARDRETWQNLRESALSHLSEAEKIYSQYRHFHGKGNVHSIRGGLYMDCGELDVAEDEASNAYALGEAKRDEILMARGRILQCMVEYSKLEERLEGSRSPSERAHLAERYALEGVEHARRTQNGRLLARALTWRGIILASDFLCDFDTARECCDEAAALSRGDFLDYIGEDIQSLKRRLLLRGSLDARLLEWSHGEVGNKSFQQIVDEFSGIVIAKVWEREDRKISRVAARLKISPKKLRRILLDAGMRDRQP
jgi:tetratricopeptide (TPR) repeat protein